MRIPNPLDIEFFSYNAWCHEPYENPWKTTYFACLLLKPMGHLPVGTEATTILMDYEKKRVVVENHGVILLDTSFGLEIK